MQGKVEESLWLNIWNCRKFCYIIQCNSQSPRRRRQVLSEEFELRRP